MNINLNFSEKEQQIIQLMAPNMTPEQIINTVLRDWYVSNRDRMFKAVKTEDQVNDEIIAVHTAKVKVDNPVV